MLTTIDIPEYLHLSDCFTVPENNFEHCQGNCLIYEKCSKAIQMLADSTNTNSADCQRRAEHEESSDSTFGDVRDGRFRQPCRRHLRILFTHSPPSTSRVSQPGLGGSTTAARSWGTSTTPLGNMAFSLHQSPSPLVHSLWLPVSSPYMR